MRGRKNQSSNINTQGKAKVIKYKSPGNAKTNISKPKKYKQPSIVSGMSINDILNMSEKKFNKLSEKDLRKVVGRLVSAVNKRVRRFEKAGISTPATRALEKSGGMLSTKGKDLNQLRTEYARARDFLNMETSTRKGFENVQKKTIQTLKERGVNITTSELNDLFVVYNKLKELDPSITYMSWKYELMSDIAQMDNSTDVETRLMQAKERYNELYEENQEQFGRDVTLYGVSGFFEI